jgi:hypothetical protein
MAGGTVLRLGLRTIHVREAFTFLEKMTTRTIRVPLILFHYHCSSIRKFK